MISPYIFQVHYYETDKMGIVHHSNYIRWMEDARVNALHDANLDFAQMEEMGILSPVLSVSCEYKIPYVFGDTVIIYTSLTKFNGVKYEVSYKMTDESGRVHSLGTSSHCFTDINMKPMRIKNKYPEIYNGYLALAENSSLDGQ